MTSRGRTPVLVDDEDDFDGSLLGLFFLPRRARRRFNGWRRGRSARPCRTGVRRDRCCNCWIPTAAMRRSRRRRRRRVAVVVETMAVRRRRRPRRQPWLMLFQFYLMIFDMS